MKKRTAIIALISMALSAGLLLSGCGVLVTTKSGAITTKDYQITDFSAVDIGDAFQVEIQRGDSYSVQITADTNSLDRTDVTRSGDTLKIGRKPWPVISSGHQTLNVRITMPRLTKLTISGSTKGTVSGFKSSDDFEARVLDASSLDLDMETGAFSAVVSASSHLTGQVTSTESDIELSESSRMDLQLTTGAFNLEASASSKATGSVQTTSTAIRLLEASSVNLTGSGGNLDLFASASSSATLPDFTIGDLHVQLSEGSKADLTVNGRITGSLNNGSQLLYAGNPVLDSSFQVNGGSKFQRTQ